MLSSAQTIRNELERSLHGRFSRLFRIVCIRRDSAMMLCHLLAHLIELDRKLEELVKTESGTTTTGTARRLT